MRIVVGRLAALVVHRGHGHDIGVLVAFVEIQNAHRIVVEIERCARREHDLRGQGVAGQRLIGRQGRRKQRRIIGRVERVVDQFGDRHRIGGDAGVGDGEAVDDVGPALLDGRRAGLVDGDRRVHVVAGDGVRVVVGRRVALVVDRGHGHDIGVPFAAVDHRIARRIEVEVERCTRREHDRLAAVGRLRRR